VTPHLSAHLKQSYPFHQSEKRVLLTDDEFKAKHGEEEYKHLALSRIQQRMRWGHQLPRTDIEFLEKYPELKGEI
jgi:hypothetical protein